MSLASPFADLDRARGALSRAAGAFVTTVHTGRHSVGGIAWRDDLLVAPAERLTRALDVRVHGSAGEAAGQVIALDLATDVGIVRCARVWEREATSAPAVPEVGESVALVGREEGELAVDWRAIRKVGAPWRSRRGATIDLRIEIDSASAEALEGSALVTGDAGVVGMLVYGPQRRLLAIPSVTIERVVAELAIHGRLRHGYLGVSLVPLPLSPEVAARWQVGRGSALVVADVRAGSPAAIAGLEVGDCLTAADGAALEGVGTLTRLIRERGPGAVVRLARRRGGALEELAVTLGERPR